MSKCCAGSSNPIGDKIDSAARVKSLEKRLLEAATSASEEAVAP